MLKLNKYLQALQMDMIGTSRDVNIYSTSQFRRCVDNFVYRHNYHTPNIGLVKRNLFLSFIEFRKKHKLLDDYPHVYSTRLTQKVIEYLKEFVDDGYSDKFDYLYAIIGVKEICQINFNNLQKYNNIVELIGASFQFIDFDNYEVSEQLFIKMNNDEFPDIIIEMILTKLPTTQYGGHEQHSFMQVLFDNRDKLSVKVRQYLNTVSIDDFDDIYKFDLGLILGQKPNIKDLSKVKYRLVGSYHVIKELYSEPLIHDVLKGFKSFMTKLESEEFFKFVISNKSNEERFKQMLMVNDGKLNPNIDYFSESEFIKWFNKLNQTEIFPMKKSDLYLKVVEKYGWENFKTICSPEPKDII